MTHTFVWSIYRRGHFIVVHNAFGL